MVSETPETEKLKTAIAENTIISVNNTKKSSVSLLITLNTNDQEHIFKTQLSKQSFRTYHCNQYCVHNTETTGLCTSDFHSISEIATTCSESHQNTECSVVCLQWPEYHKRDCGVRNGFIDPLICLCSQNLNSNFSHSTLIEKCHTHKEITGSCKSKCECTKENFTFVKILDTTKVNLQHTENSLKRRLDYSCDFAVPLKRKQENVKLKATPTQNQNITVKPSNLKNQDYKNSKNLYDEIFNNTESIDVLLSKNNSRQIPILQAIVDNISSNMSISEYKRPLRMDAIADVDGGYAKTSTTDELAAPNAPNHFLNANTSSMATLSNIGNSCYLNSVIYTLRFAPLFLHNLHHLVIDLNQLNQRLGYRCKSSSLGRNVSGLQGSSGRSLSSKDLASLSINSNLTEVTKSNRQVVTEKLHELFHNLHRNELIDADPFHPVHFLNAIQDVSSTFEGNQQQDAHELLMCILDSIRETCQSLTKIISDCPDIVFNGCGNVPEQIEATPPQTTSINSAPSFKAILNNFTRKSKRKDDKSKVIKAPESPSRDNLINDTLDSAIVKSKNKLPEEESQEQREKLNEKIKKMRLDFFCEDFEGITVSTTKCLTCETETEQKETMIDISVPISGQETMETMENPQLFFQNSCITKEFFRGENKYRCEKCSGYMEAIRSISFEVLPRLLVIQLKRFSGGMEKINSYIPTPFTLQCFCRKCFALPENKKIHVYKLYSVITHVGATLSAGHYITYTCSLDAYREYVNCEKDKRKLMQCQPEKQQSQQHNLSGIDRSNGGLSGIEKIKKRSWLRKSDNRGKASSSTDLTKSIKCMNGNSVIASANSTSNDVLSAEGGNLVPCQALNCCGIHTKGSLLIYSNGNNNCDTGMSEYSNISNLKDQSSGGISSKIDSTPFSEINVNNGLVIPTPPNSSTAISHNFHEPIWFMCDDDKIKSMPQQEFKELLSPNRKVMITPYLLFYARNDVN